MSGISRGGASASVLMVAALLLSTCSRSSSPSAPPPPPMPTVTFTAAGTPGPDTIFFAENTATDGSRLVLNLHTRNVTALYGISLAFDYPSNVLQYSSVAEGGFLRQDNVNTSLLIDEPETGEILIGLTRLGNVGGRSGSGLLLTLEFEATAAGSGDFELTQTEAFGPQARLKPEIRWLSGSVRVTR